MNPLIKPRSSPLNPELLILTLAEFICLSHDTVTPEIPCCSLERQSPLAETETSRYFSRATSVYLQASVKAAFP